MSVTHGEAAEGQTTSNSRGCVAATVRSITEPAICIPSPAICRAATSQGAGVLRPSRDVLEDQSAHDGCGRVRIRAGTNGSAFRIDDPTCWSNRPVPQLAGVIGAPAVRCADGSQGAGMKPTHRETAEPEPARDGDR